MVVLAIAAGLLIGLSLGALGGGGSILAVPALVYLLGQSAHQATTASLLVVGIAAMAGAVVHARAGRVRLREGIVFGVLGVAGSYAGSLASAAVPANVLLAGFGVLMLAVAAVMTARRRARPAVSGVTSRPAAESAAPLPATLPSASPQMAAVASGSAGPAASPAAVPDQRLPGAAETGSGRGAARRYPRRPVVIAAAATVVGLITGFFGVGGGFVVVPALVLILGFDMPAAAGTSLVVIAINSAAALASRAAHGGITLDWSVTGIFTIAAIAGVLAGGRLAGRVRPERLATAFTILIIAVAGYTLARSFSGLS